MKNRLLSLLALFFFIGSQNIAAEGVDLGLDQVEKGNETAFFSQGILNLDGLGELVIVQGKNGELGILVNLPKEYIDTKGNPISPIEMEIREEETGQVIFMTSSSGNLIYPNNLKKGDYLVNVKVKSFQMQQLIQL